jgi:hypothetical protein
MRAKTLKAKTTESAADALRQATADGFQPTLALVFLSIKQDRQAICQLLKKQGMAWPSLAPPLQVNLLMVTWRKEQRL